jgi:hypothetical protein
MPPPPPSTNSNLPSAPWPKVFWYSGSLSGSSKLTFCVTEIPRPREFFPDLVVITMAPLAAREPYSAAAFGPLRTVIDSMSLGLTSAAALP